MNFKLNVQSLLLLIALTFSFSCVSTKKFDAMQTDLQAKIQMAEQQLVECKEGAITFRQTSQSEKSTLERQLSTSQTSTQLLEQQIQNLKDQVADLKKQRDAQLSQVGDLTVLSKSANENIAQTLSQLEKKDKYIRLLQAARTKADSINLALAVNLKSVLKDGIEDEDVEIKVDKTVVFINLSDKMLYQSGSSELTSRAQEVLGKIAKIIEDRPNLEVMVEGYTDNVPIKTTGIKDNWDLSVKRATSVVRVLQNTYSIDPNRLIAAGRGEYNALASNDTAEGRAINRRTRIIIMPKLNQFYDLLNPSNMEE
jgi:chemotaxis protein MotB